MAKTTPPSKEETRRQMAIYIDFLPSDTIEQQQIKILAQEQRESLKKVLFPSIL